MRYLIGVLALVLVGCGGSPTSPSPQPAPAPTPAPSPAPAPAPSPAPTPTPAPILANLAGTWAGRLFVTLPTGRSSVVTTATMTQAGETISGTWRITTPNNDGFGTIDGRVRLVGNASVFEGIVTMNTSAATDASVLCKGQTGFSGETRDKELSWSAPVMDFTGTCQNALTDLVWTMTR